jgi:hypothetical protein
MLLLTYESTQCHKPRSVTLTQHETSDVADIHYYESESSCFRKGELSVCMQADPQLTNVPVLRSSLIYIYVYALHKVHKSEFSVWRLCLFFHAWLYLYN